MVFDVLAVFILGCAKSMQPIKIKMIFSFYKRIGEQMTQCFASNRMSNCS